MKKYLLLLVLLFSVPSFAATCKISEYESLVYDSEGRVVLVAAEPAITVQNITYTSSTASAAFNSKTLFVRIVCDAKAHFEFGSAPSATANDPYVTSDTAEYFGIAGGGTWKVAFYDGSS